MFVVFIDFTLNQHPERELKINEIIEISLSIYQNKNSLFSYNNFVYPILYKNVYNDDIIWDDVKDSKTLETLLPELQKKGVTNYDITLVIFENQNKMQAFFKETEIKGIQILWKWYTTFANLIPHVQLQQYLSSAVKPIFEINHYYKSDKDEHPLNNVRLMQEKFFEEILQTKKIKAQGYESQIFLDEKCPYKEFNSVENNQVRIEQQNYEKIIGNEINNQKVQKKRNMNMNDFDYLAIFDGSSPRSANNENQLLQYGVVIYDLVKQQTIKNCILFQYIDSDLSEEEMQGQQLDFLNREVYEKEKVSKKEGLKILREFIMSFKKIALVMQHSYIYQKLIAEQGENEVLLHSLILKKEMKGVIQETHEMNLNLDKMTQVLQLRQRIDQYDVIQNCFIMGDIIQRLQQKGWYCKSQNMVAIQINN